jgi:hypothetical protein
MSMKHLVAGVIAALPLASGCSTFKPDYWYSHGWIAEPMQIVRDGEALPFNKETCFEGLGLPTFTYQIPDGWICIWRDTLFRPPSGCKGHWDVLIAFDADGNFMPPDPKTNYGLRFCRECGCDLRTVDGDRCPHCGMAIERKADR